MPTTSTGMYISGWRKTKIMDVSQDECWKICALALALELMTGRKTLRILLSGRLVNPENPCGKVRGDREDRGGILSARR